jgi:hypothetical protein
MLLDLRKKTAESPDNSLRSAPEIERVLARLYSKLMSSPKLLKMGVKFGRFTQKLERMTPVFSPLTKDGKWIRNAHIPILSRWTKSRDLPTLPKQTFHELWEKELSRDDS